MVGGVSAVLQGGKFGHGFVSSLVTASMKGFMNPKTGTYADAVRRTAIAGVVGGTVSKLTGGKFANGAVTSAMQWWYNAEGNPKFQSPDAPLIKWFKSILDGSEQLGSSIEGIANDVGTSAGKTMNSLAKDPARTAANAVSRVGTCAFAVGAGCVLAASAGVVGASDILEQTTGLDPAQRGAENVLMGGWG